MSIGVILLSPDAASTFAKNGAGCIHPRNGEKICAEMAASLRSPADLAHVALLHPGQSHEEWQCWLKSGGAPHIDADRGLVFDTLESTLTAAAEGHGVAIGDPRMARDRLQAGTLATPFIDVAQNGLSYFVVYPSQRAAQPKIRALADVLSRLARED